MPIDEKQGERMEAEIDALIAEGLVVVIREQSDAATIAAREAAGYPMARLFDGRGESVARLGRIR